MTMIPASTPRPRRTAPAASSTFGKKAAATLAAGLVTLCLAGCAQQPPRERDFNAEAVKQMGYWGGEPGF